MTDHASSLDRLRAKKKPGIRNETTKERGQRWSKADQQADAATRKTTRAES